MKATAPDGRTWTVRRRWFPRYEGRGLRERLRQRPQGRQRDRSDDGGHWWDWVDPFSFLPDDSLTAWLVGVLVVGLLIVLAVFGLPLLLALVDVVVVSVVAVGGVVARVLLRRPWTLEATASSGERRIRQVVGWRDAGRAARTWAEELRSGSFEL